MFELFIFVAQIIATEYKEIRNNPIAVAAICKKYGLIDMTSDEKELLYSLVDDFALD